MKPGELIRHLPNREVDDDKQIGPDRGYAGWGPHEDYMIKTGKRFGWEEVIYHNSWSQFDKMGPTEYNLVADFYFETDTVYIACEECNGKGELGILGGADPGQVKATSCEVCHGDGEVPSEATSLTLNIWMLHPRKGASKGVEIKNIQEEELPEIKKFLRNSWALHKQHFLWVEED